VPAAVIGEITGQKGVIELTDGQGCRPLPLFAQDEIIKLD
jgi:hypothetical protein